MSNWVSIADYGLQGLNGFGATPGFDSQEVMKALTAGGEVSVGDVGSHVLKVESLEASLKVLSHTSKHVKLWRNMSKTPAYSTVEEFNQVTDYGLNVGGFLNEGELPTNTDSQYTRKAQLVKFMGTTRQVSHPATLVNAAHGPLIEQNNNEGILWMLRRIEESLFKGDSSLAAVGTEGQSWDGLDALIDPASYIDLAGDPLQESTIEEATQLIIDEFGFPNEAYMPTRVKSNLLKTLQSRQRFPMPYAQQGRIGQSIYHMETDAGDIALEADVFLKKQPGAPVASVGTGVPATPASIAVAAQAGSGVGTFDKSQGSADAGYAYVVTAANRFGESAPTAVPGALTAMTGVNAAAGWEFALTITNTAGAADTEYFRVYRTEAQASGGAVPAITDVTANGDPAYSLVAEIPCADQANGGVTTSEDTNFIMPNTYQGYIGQNDESVFTFRQLAPLMKMDLAVVEPAYRWMILLYGTPVLFAPKKWIRLLNIGDLR